MLDKISELTNSKQAISAIKIDVENFEFFVLDGGKELLKKHQPVIYAELWDNANRHSCFQLLIALGYQTFVVINNQLVLFDPQIHQKQTFIFLTAQKK